MANTSPEIWKEEGICAIEFLLLFRCHDGIALKRKRAVIWYVDVPDQKKLIFESVYLQDVRL